MKIISHGLRNNLLFYNAIFEYFQSTFWRIQYPGWKMSKERLIHKTRMDRIKNACMILDSIYNGKMF